MNLKFYFKSLACFYLGLNMVDKKESDSDESQEFDEDAEEVDFGEEEEQSEDDSSDEGEDEMAETKPGSKKRSLLPTNSQQDV